MRRLALAATIVLVAHASSHATVLGGGLVDTDCTVGFEGVTATDGASEVVCTDGDPACDADGTADGVCTIVVRACSHLASSGCTARDVTSVAIAGLGLARPPLAGSGRECGAEDPVSLPVGSAAGATMIARNDTAVEDVDYLALCCQSASSTFGAARCALALDPGIAGCRGALPASFTATLEKARALVEQAASDPASTRRATRHAIHAVGRLRAIAKKVARSDTCGYALGLWTTEAQARLRATRR